MFIRGLKKRNLKPEHYRFAVATLWPVAVTACLVALEPGLDHYRRVEASYAAQCASEPCWARARESSSLSLINADSRQCAWVLVMLGPVAFALPFMGGTTFGGLAIVGCLLLVSMVNAGVFLVSTRSVKVILITLGLFLWFSVGCVATLVGT